MNLLCIIYLIVKAIVILETKKQANIHNYKARYWRHLLDNQ